MLLKGADKMTNDEITIRLAEMGVEQSRSEAEIWKVLNELHAEVSVQADVIHCLAAHVPDLNQVMENLLDRKDEMLERLPSENLKQLSSALLDRWHTKLLHAQRVLGKGTP